jgi:pilus assembly protein Flp/PilA
VREEVERTVWDGRSRLRGALESRRGQGMVEYALILILLAIIVIAVATTMGREVSMVFQEPVAAVKKLF